MLNKVREKRHILLRVKIPVSELTSRLEGIRQHSDVLAVCPEATGNNYQGVKSATLGLFNRHTLVLPQYFSKCVYTSAELNSIAVSISALKFKSIVFSGMPQYVQAIIDQLNKHGRRKTTKLFFIYHGSLASNSEYGKETSGYLKWLLDAAITGSIDKLGFVKKGMAELFTSLQKITASHLMLKTPETESFEYLNDDVLNIGVLGSNHYRKNFHNQVAAALLFKDALVHIKPADDLKYLKHNDRIVEHRHFTDHSGFIKLLGTMQINFYVTFSECWGQLITESLISGVPCLASYNSGIFDFDEELMAQLVVQDFDNPMAIYNQAKEVLENRKEISERGIAYVKQLNLKADAMLQLFLNA